MVRAIKYDLAPGTKVAHSLVLYTAKGADTHSAVKGRSPGGVLGSCQRRFTTRYRSAKLSVGPQWSA